MCLASELPLGEGSRGCSKGIGCGRGPASMKLEAKLNPSPTLEQPLPGRFAASLYYFN